MAQARSDAGLRGVGVGALILAPLVIAGIASAVGIPRSGELSRDSMIRTQDPDPPPIVHQAEAQIAVDPYNPRHLIGVAQEGRDPFGGARANGYYVTGNGGRTWRRGLLPNASRITGGNCPRISDPVVAIGPRRRAYYASICVFPDDHLQLLVSRSGDGGRSWSSPVKVAGGVSVREGVPDKEWIAVDNGRRSRNRGNVYVVWTDYHRFRTEVHFARSTNGGRTFRNFGAIAPRSDTQAAWPIVVVRPNGTIVVVYGSRTEEYDRELQVIRSHDGGRRWSRPRRIAKYEEGSLVGVRDDLGFSVYAHPRNASIAVAFQAKGRGADDTDIVTRVSPNGGRTWARRVRIPDGSSAAQITPAIATAGRRISVLFQERIPGSGRSYVMKVAQSRSGGRRFSRGRRISPVFSAQNAAHSYQRGAFWGDYAGLAAAGNVAFALWVDSRSAQGGNDVFYAQIGGRR